MERVLVTGIPRSGTTLVAAMINDLDRSLCLSEPSRHVEWLETSSSRREYADRVIGDFAVSYTHLTLPTIYSV